MMPNKNPSTERFGAPVFQQYRQHPEKGGKEHNSPVPGAPTSGRKSRVSGGGGERDKHHTHEDRERS